MRAWLTWLRIKWEYRKYPLWVFDTGDTEPRRLTYSEAKEMGFL